MASIRIVTNLPNLALETTPFSTEHHVALEPAFDPPVCKMYFAVEVLGEYEGDWGEDVPDEHPERPAAAWDEVVVQRNDGAPLLVGDVVVQLHQYFQRLRGSILKAITPVYNIEHSQPIYALPPENVHVYFGGFGDQTVKGKENVVVSLWFDGLDGMTMDQHWSNARSEAASGTELSNGASQYSLNHQNATFEERLAWGASNSLADGLTGFQYYGTFRNHDCMPNPGHRPSGGADTCARS
jgi:hypothetical protein